MSSLRPPRARESQANIQLGQQSEQLLSLSREQFDGIREQYRQNLRNTGNDVARQTARGVASANQAPATRGLRSLQRPAGGGAMGSAANQVTANSHSRRLQAGLNLGAHGMRQAGTSMSSLGALAGIQQQRNNASADRRSQTQQGLGQLAGIAGYSAYQHFNRPPPVPTTGPNGLPESF